MGHSSRGPRRHAKPRPKYRNTSAPTQIMGEIDAACPQTIQHLVQGQDKLHGTADLCAQ